jgi:5'-deoxynucleotidase YfbR-like HD superfamily hydrolase
MTKPDPLFFSLQQMIIDLSLIDRNHYLAKTDRRENDIEHSLTVAILSWYVHDKYKINLDIAKILKYAITHDFVERYAGDVNTFASIDERNAKVVREQDSLNRLSDEYGGFSDMIASMQGYELKIDEESLFVWTIDKMQQLIMGDMDQWRPYAELPITYDQFAARYEELLEKSSKYCREIFEGLVEYSKSTYYDQPLHR